MTDRPWLAARPETFWLVNAPQVHSCIAHVLEGGDPDNPRFQLVMHDGSTHDDIINGQDIHDAKPLIVLSEEALAQLTRGGTQ